MTKVGERMNGNHSQHKTHNLMRIEESLQALRQAMHSAMNRGDVQEVAIRIGFKQGRFVKPRVRMEQEIG